MTNETSTAPAEPWIPSDGDLASRLALVRHHMGWNVKEAARECGVPAATWRLWEEGSLPRNLVTISMAIATKTGCDYLWLVHGPSRGAVRSSTVQYLATGAKLIATIGGGAAPNGRAGRSIHRSSPTRPVRQTRPLVGGSTRPLTPTAV